MITDQGEQRMSVPKSNLTVVCVGRMKQGLERDLADRYFERARLAGIPIGARLSLKETGESLARRGEDRKAEEASAIRALLPAGAIVATFDERGRAFTSADFADIVGSSLDTGAGLGLVIGGPDGLDAAFRDAARHVIAFGAMTWPHRLVRVMVTEQIYRAITILSGHPYHRA